MLGPLAVSQEPRNFGTSLHSNSAMWAAICILAASYGRGNRVGMSVVIGSPNGRLANLKLLGDLRE